MDIRLSGFGKAVDFLRTKTGFFICIMIPMIAFFLFELYKLIVVIVEVKGSEAVKLDEEEIKRRAVEEYIAEQQKKQQSDEKTTDN